MGKRTIVIPAVKKQGQVMEQPKLRVCAYARVSTKTSNQEPSYEMQVSYYMEKIKGNPLWEYAGIYADQGISGTKIYRRDEFKTMLMECEKGNIDLILTKSISRFCRNVVDCLQTIRKLKTLGVGVWFEKENINTLTDNSELMLSILAAIAQAESEDFGGNNRWSVLRRFEEGKFAISTPAFGYKNDEDYNLVPHEINAELARWMFESYLNGIGTYQIAKLMNQAGIKPIRHGKAWTDSVVMGMLKNSVYEGDLLLQKTYRDMRGTFTRRKNKGETEKYLVHDDHQALITKEEAHAVKKLLDYRKDVLNSASEKGLNRYVLSGKIICAECGSHFKRKILCDGKKIVWSCKQHIRDKHTCGMKAIDEKTIHDAFILMWNKLYTNKGEILEPYFDSLMRMMNRFEARQIEQLDSEIMKLSEQCRILNQVMKEGYIDTALFMEKYNQLLQKLTNCRRNRNQIGKQKKMRNEVAKTGELIKLLDQENCILTEFREDLFERVVKEVRVSIEHDVIFCLYNGLCLKEISTKEKR